MPTGPEAFLELLGVSGLRPCVWTHVKRGVVPHSSGQWNVRKIPKRRRRSTPFTGIHFCRPYLLVHWSGWVCPGSGGSRSRPSDMDSGKLAFMSGAPRSASSSLKRPLPFIGGAMFIAWRLTRPVLGECRWGPMCLDPPKKRPCGTFDKYRYDADAGSYVSLTFQLDCNHHCRPQPTLQILFPFLYEICHCTATCNMTNLRCFLS